MDSRDRARRDEGDRAYYNLPRLTWADVDPAIGQDLKELSFLIQLAVDDLTGASRGAKPGTEVPEAALPVRLAIRMFELANRMYSAAAGDEQDLRQVITTLRTALAVCWDMYSLDKAERTTVAEHMRGLREKIEDFEADLRGFAAAKGTGENQDA